MRLQPPAKALAPRALQPCHWAKGRDGGTGRSRWPRGGTGQRHREQQGWEAGKGSGHGARQPPAGVSLQGCWCEPSGTARAGSSLTHLPSHPSPCHCSFSHSPSLTPLTMALFLPSGRRLHSTVGEVAEPVHQQGYPRGCHRQ